MALELVFVHTPKTGGTALNAVLTQVFGDALLVMNDRPVDPESPMHTDRDAYLAQDHRKALLNKRAVTGHFWLPKYLGVAAHLRATVLREPVDRLISHYFFWKASPFAARQREHSVWRRFLDEAPDIETFARYDGLRNFYTGLLFSSVDMRVFDHIADYRDVTADPASFMSRLGLGVALGHANQTKSRMPRYDQERGEILANQALMGRLRDSLAAEIDFYETWAGRT